MSGMLGSMRMKRVVFVAGLLSMLTLPLLSFAQLTSERDSLLHSEIRSALTSDPRSASLSEAELSAMVSALADEAKTQGVVDDYIPPAPTFARLEDLVPTYAVFGYSMTATAILFIIVLSALLIAMILLFNPSATALVTR